MTYKDAEAIIGMALISLAFYGCVVAGRKADRYRSMRSIIGKFTVEMPK